MGFGKWLRESSETYLLEAARDEVGARYGIGRAPALEHGLEPLFWRRVFVPAYRKLPWRLRLAVIRAMPGSHRQTWAPAPVRHDPAI